MNVCVADAVAIKEIAVRKAFALGAGAVRVASAAADETSRGRMTVAFARGDFATWRFDDEYARRSADPASVMPGARSVVCIAVPYAPAAAGGYLRGRISSYARRPDYHRSVRSLLRAVAAAIDAAAGEAVTLVACDTKPIAERAFAASSGLGWIGKHTLAIVPELGSYVFLGEILTTLPLPPDEPLRKNCGSCRRCADACPTGALRADYTIDATRCISDLTQRPDGIPLRMRALVGDWVWGCDICQVVCPPGQPARRAAAAGAQDESPALVELLGLRGSAFKRKYRPSAMGWRGPAVLRRNAAVALGNALDRSTVPALAQSLRTDSHPMVRGHVAWALGRIGSPSALSALRTRYAAEEDTGVRAEIRAALAPFERRATERGSNR